MTSVRLPTNAYLQHETTYYWRVNIQYGGDATQGPLWSFTTAAAPDE